MNVESMIIESVEVYREETLELLREMVRTPSMSGSETAMQEIVAREYHTLSLETDIWEIPEEELRAHPAYVPVDQSYAGRPNVVGILRGTGGGRSLILNGHADVVPVGHEGIWQHGPWSAEFVDGRVYGRGSSDMKGGCAASILAVKTLLHAGIRLKGDLILESVLDEETGGNGTLACIIRGYTADACIFNEPTGLDTTAISSRGAQYFRITVPGQEGGTEYKHSLVNPIGKAFEIYQAVEAYSIMRESTADHHLYRTGHVTRVPLGICRINAGEWPSTVASQCVMEGTIECLPGEDIHNVKEAFQKYLLEWAGKDSWLRDHPPKIEWFGLWFDAAEISPDHPLVVTMRESVRSVTGENLQVAGGGGCDLRLPIVYGDTPAVLFGPRGGMIHSTDEYVEFEQVIKCAAILALIATRWCGVETREPGSS